MKRRRAWHSLVRHGGPAPRRRGRAAGTAKGRLTRTPAISPAVQTPGGHRVSCDGKGAAAGGDVRWWTPRPADRDAHIADPAWRCAWPRLRPGRRVCDGGGTRTRSAGVIDTTTAAALRVPLAELPLPPGRGDHGPTTAGSGCFFGSAPRADEPDHVEPAPGATVLTWCMSPTRKAGEYLDRLQDNIGPLAHLADLTNEHGF